jgi:RNA polymerase sigma-70 factor, ECF subfamily
LEIITELKRLNNKSTDKINQLQLEKDQPEHMKDEELLEQIKSGDMDAFETLFRKYYAPLFNYAHTFVKQKDDADEVVQDLFFNIWKNKEKLNISSSFKSYVYRAVYNNSIQRIRKQQKSISLNKRHALDGTTSYLEPDFIQIKELTDTIEKVLQQLPERSRKIFELSRFEGLKYHEIAKKLSISIKTVEANMSKSLKTFRKYLKEYRNFILLF